MDINLDDLVRPGGAEPAVSAREIVEGDLAALAAGRESAIPPRKKLRYKHHSLAKSLASGMSERQAAIIAGFAPVTVSILKNDPAFRDLVDFYAADVAKSFDRINEQKVRVASKLLDDIEQDVDDGKLTFNQKRDTAFGLLDRTEYGLKRDSGAEVHLHAHFADKLEAARRRAPPPIQRYTAEGGASPVLDATFEVIDDAQR